MPKVIAFTRSRSNVNREIRRDTEPLDSAVERSEENVSIEKNSADTIQISIVIPTCGRPHLLSRCLSSLILQRFDASRFEIIVVDDAPNCKTREVVMNWAEHAARRGPVITYIASEGPHGPASARNIGWRTARGSIVAFTDDDTVARTDWLEKGLRAFRAGDVQAVWGRIVMPLHRVPTDYELDAKNLEKAEFVTANCFCLKSVLDQLDGFDERFRFAWREDADLYFRLLRNNVNVTHAPAAVVVHPIRPAPWGVSLTQQRKILFDALLFKKHPELYRQKIRAVPRWDYYVIVAALIVCILGLALRMQTVAAVAGGLWFVLTSYFCVIRLKHTARTAAHISEMAVTSALIPPLAVFWRTVGAVRFRTRFI